MIISYVLYLDFFISEINYVPTVVENVISLIVCMCVFIVPIKYFFPVLFLFFECAEIAVLVIN